MPQEPIEDENCISWDIGYLAGMQGATFGIGWSEELCAIIAAQQYKRACRTFHLNRDKYLNGWMQGFRDSITYTVVVLVYTGG